MAVTEVTEAGCGQNASSDEPTLPRVLVLMAAYNGALWLNEQVDSILKQNGVHVRLVISDDWSSDGTPALLERLRIDPRVSTVAPPQRTGSAAQNFFWLLRQPQEANFDFVALADQDDVWLEQKLLAGCAALSTSDAGGYSCAVTAFWPDGTRRDLHQESKTTASDYLFEGAGQGCTFLLQASFFSRLQRFLLEHAPSTSAIHYHDWALYALSRVWTIGWIFDPNRHVLYRQHEHNDTGARASSAGIVRRLKQLRNGWYGNQLTRIAQLCEQAGLQPRVQQWRNLLSAPPSLGRRIKLARFVLRGGRRRKTDEMALLFAVLCGWI
jgi:rhamnosyltransferase